MIKFGQTKTRTSRSLCLCFLVLVFTTLFSGKPRAFSAIVSASTDSSPERPEGRTESVDPFKGPNFLKVLLDPRQDAAINDLPIKERPHFMKDLEIETGTQIFFSRKGQWYEDSSGFSAKVLTIAGEAADVLGAFSRSALPSHDGNGEMYAKFLVPNLAIRQLIGTKGSVIQEAERQSGAGIQIRQEFPDRSEGIVSVKGRAHNIDGVVKWMLDQQDAYDEDTRRAMRNMITTKYGPGKLEYTEIFIKMSDNQAASFIGKGGDNIKNVASKFYVKMGIDRESDDSNLLRIAGCLGDVQAVHSFILQHNNAMEKRWANRIEQDGIDDGRPSLSE